jgi:hypothetical protein
MAHTIAFDKVWNKVRNLPRLTTDNVETIRFSLKELFAGEEYLLHKPIDWYVDNGIDLRTIFEVSSRGEFAEMQDRYGCFMCDILMSSSDLDYEDEPDPDMYANVSYESIRDWMRQNYRTVFIDWYSHSEEDILIYLRGQDWALIGCDTADLYNLKTFHIENRTDWTCRRSKYHVKSFIGRDGFSNIYEVPIGETALHEDLGTSLEELKDASKPGGAPVTLTYNGPLIIGEYADQHLARPLCKLSAVEVVRFDAKIIILRMEIYHEFRHLRRKALNVMFALDQTILYYYTSGTVDLRGRTCKFRENYFVAPEMWAPVEP